jgi:hypothetical protein
MMGGLEPEPAALEVADDVLLMEATLGHAATRAGRTTALLPAAQQRQRDAEVRKTKEREKQRQARELEDRLEVGKGQELEDIESLRPRLDGDWNQVQRRLFAGLNRGLDNLAARIVDQLTTSMICRTSSPTPAAPRAGRRRPAPAGPDRRRAGEASPRGRIDPDYRGQLDTNQRPQGGWLRVRGLPEAVP